MTTTEYLLGEVRTQRELLGNMISRLEEKDRLDVSDCRVFEVVSRIVENNLRQLKHMAAVDFFQTASEARCQGLEVSV